MQSLAFLAGLCLFVGAAAQTDPDPFRRMSLDQFMRESLVTQVPISFELPTQYAPVELPKKRPPTALWLEQGYHEETLRTGRMPRQAAYFRGSLALSVAYDDRQARFLCGKAPCEIVLRENMARAGYRVLEFERSKIGEIQVMFMAAETAIAPGSPSAPLYQAYIPLGAGTGVVQVSHRPATGLAGESRAVWARFKQSLTPLTLAPTTR